MDKVGTKVTRPPGGESNNIFGGGPGSSPEPRHTGGTRAHHAPDSDIFGPRHSAPDQPQGAPHRPHHAAADSNIFGPPEEEIRRRPCNNNITADSGIFGGGGSENPSASTAGSPQSCAAPRRGVGQEDTQAKLFGESSPLPRPPEVKTADANGNGFVRVRQPPGGKSSGLW